jgi:manganese-dependent inorganic pyrophosphatase
MIKVFGHLNPDTDTTCSAIAFAWYLTNAKQLSATPYVLGDLNKETAYVLEKFGHIAPATLSEVTADDSVVLVDTNNPEELLPSFAEAKLLEIVDHHKLVGGISTPEPVTITMRTVACTTTIIWQLAKEANLTLPNDIAGLMLAAIISDTLKFTSPTTTDVDKAAAQALAEISGVNVDELADGMFAAKSDLTGMAPADLLTMDSKVFTLGGKQIRVSSLETTKPANALAMQTELVTAMADMKASSGLDAVFFFVVDIIASSATLIVASDFEREVAEKSFEKTVTNGLMELPGVVSRKKQIIPALEKALS